MKIKIEDTFKLKLNRQVDYIAGDKPIAAKRFRRKIINQITKTALHPWINRKSNYFNDENIRDLIVEVYTITYKIDPKEIIIFGLLKWEEGY